MKKFLLGLAIMISFASASLLSADESVSKPSQNRPLLQIVSPSQGQRFSAGQMLPVSWKAQSVSRYWFVLSSQKVQQLQWTGCSGLLDAGVVDDDNASSTLTSKHTQIRLVPDETVSSDDWVLTIQQLDVSSGTIVKSAPFIIQSSITIEGLVSGDQSCKPASTPNDFILNRKQYQYDGSIVVVLGKKYVFNHYAWINADNPNDKYLVSPPLSPPVLSHEPVRPTIWVSGLRALWNRSRHGDLVAQATIDQMIIVGEPAARDDILYWMKTSARQGDGSAAIELGWIYLYGRGTVPNPEEAAFWFSQGPEREGELGRTMADTVVRGYGPSLASFREEIRKNFEAGQLFLQHYGSRPPKPLVFKDFGGCPFECCTYGHWKATEQVTVLDHPEGRPIGHLTPGQTVEVSTGEIDVVPGVSIVTGKDRGTSTVDCRRGDIVELLSNQGEGVMTIRRHGEITSDNPEELCEGRLGSVYPPHSRWWAEVTLPDGRKGWVDVQDQFTGSDSCA